MLSIGILLSELSHSPEGPILEGIWPVFVGLVLAGAVTVLLLILKNFRRKDP